MKDFSRIALVASLAVLFIVLSIVLPRIDMLAFLAPFGKALPWIAFGLLFWCFGGCRSRGCCRSKASSAEAQV